MVIQNSTPILIDIEIYHSLNKIETTFIRNRLHLFKSLPSQGQIIKRKSS